MSQVATPTISIGCPSFGDYDSTVTATNVGSIRLISNTLADVSTYTVFFTGGIAHGSEIITWAGGIVQFNIASGVTTVADILALVGTASVKGTPWATLSQINAGILYAQVTYFRFDELHNYQAQGTTFSNKPALVTMACTTATAFIIYSTDGTDPYVGYVSTGNYYQYTQPFFIYDTTTFKLMGIYPTCAYDPSELATQTFTYVPEAPAAAVCNDGTIIAPTTALDIIKRALRILCVSETGEEPDGPEAEDFLQQLNWLVQSWVNEKLMSWYVLNEIFTLKAGQSNYTIGPDATKDFNTSLPISIESAFIRTVSGAFSLDFPLAILNNTEYNLIHMKSLQTIYPKYLMFTRSYPYGCVDLWPVPSQSISISLTQRKQFIQFTGLTDVVCLPPGYKDALAYWLAIKMSPEYGGGIDAVTMKLAEEAKGVLKNTNYRPVIMSTGLPSRRGRFNIFQGM